MAFKPFGRLTPSLGTTQSRSWQLRSLPSTFSYCLQSRGCGGEQFWPRGPRARRLGTERRIGRTDVLRFIKILNTSKSFREFCPHPRGHGIERSNRSVGDAHTSIILPSVWPWTKWDRSYFEIHTRGVVQYYVRSAYLINSSGATNPHWRLSQDVYLA